MKRVTKRMLQVLYILVAVSSTLLAQTGSSSVTGTVADVSGGALPGVDTAQCRKHAIPGLVEARVCGAGDEGRREAVGPADHQRADSDRLRSSIARGRLGHD